MSRLIRFSMHIYVVFHLYGSAELIYIVFTLSLFAWHEQMRFIYSNEIIIIID